MSVSACSVAGGWPELYPQGVDALRAVGEWAVRRHTHTHTVTHQSPQCEPPSNLESHKRAPTFRKRETGWKKYKMTHEVLGAK